MPILGQGAAVAPTPSPLDKALRDGAEASERRPAVGGPSQAWGRPSAAWPARPVTTCWCLGAGRPGLPSARLSSAGCCASSSSAENGGEWLRGAGTTSGGWGWRAGWGAGQPGERRGSVEATAPQVFGDDDVCHGVEDELDVVGVGGTGDVGIDLLVGGLVLALVLGLDVSHGFREGAGACGRDADGSG